MTNLPFTGKFKITKFYGVPGNYKAKYHTGIDIVGISNSNVYSVCDGTVKEIHNIDDNSYGKYVKIIDNATQKIFLFAHLDKIFVKKNTLVNRLSIIGKMGSTGNSSGPHTHIELRSATDKYGEDENPANYMGLINCSLDTIYNSSSFQLNVSKIPNLKYASYCQNLEWQKEKKNGEMSGLYGQGLRIEAIIINADIPIQYRVYIENKWSEWFSNGCMAGIIEKSQKIEALEIQSSKNTIIGQGYVENIGYQDEVCGTQIIIGTTNKNLRLEGFKLKFL